MGIARVGSFTADYTAISGTNGSISFSAPTSGNLIIVAAAQHDDLAPATNPSGWTALSYSAGSSEGTVIWYKESDGTETSASWTYAKSLSGGKAWFLEYSGVDTADLFDQEATNSGVASSYTHGAIDPPDLAYLHFGVCAVSSATLASSVDDGFTLIDSDNTGSESGYIIEKILTAEGGSVNPVLSTGGFGPFANSHATFNEAASSGQQILTLRHDGKY